MPGSGTSQHHHLQQQQHQDETEQHGQQQQQQKPKEKTQRWGTGVDTFTQIIREEDEDQDTNQLQQLLGDVKKEQQQLRSNGSAGGGGGVGGQVEAATPTAAEEKRKMQLMGGKGDANQRQGTLRQLWDSMWLRRSRRKVAQNGHGGGFVTRGEQQQQQEQEQQRKMKRSGSSERSSRTELRDDGFDFQTVLDLDHNQKIELRFYGYRESALKSLLYYLILCATLGFMALVFHWNQHWALFVRRKRCSLREAQFMLIVEQYKHTDASKHDAIHTEAMQMSSGQRAKVEKELEVYFVETVHRVGVEDVKEQYLSERRRGVEKVAKREPNASHEVVKEKWFERFLKRACLFEDPEVEVKIKGSGQADAEEGKMSKSPDTVTTLVMDDEMTDQERTLHDGALKRAEEIRIHEHFLKFLHFSVHFDDGVFDALNELNFFRYKQLRYVWNEKEGQFVKIMGLEENVPSKLLQPQFGLSIAEQMSRRLVYGLNKIEIPMNSTFQLIYMEFLNPFYVFQIFSCVLWFFYNYYYYACVIILMSAFGITLSVIQTKQNQNSLYQKVTDANKSTEYVNVLVVLEEDPANDDEEVGEEGKQTRTRTNSEREGAENPETGGVQAKPRKSARGMDLLKQLFVLPRSGGGGGGGGGGGSKRKRRKRRITRTSTRSDGSESESGSSSESGESEDSEFENAEDYLERPGGGAGADGKVNPIDAQRRSRRESKKRYQFKQQKMKYLVPGDVMEIPSNGCVMQCDIVLLSGNCIMDESMLTGECVPVTKTPLLKNNTSFLFDQKTYSRHILFAGTKLIQTRYIGGERVLGMVINVGIKTAKGDLIRSILYPPPVDYKFEQDSYKFIKLLSLVAFIGFLYTVVTKITRGVEWTKIAVESLDLITIAVPPALPAAMSVGRMYAQKRLKKKDVYCISPRSINVSGSVDLVCFDKTGTLTEDGLDMWAVVPVEKEEVPLSPGRGGDLKEREILSQSPALSDDKTETPTHTSGGGTGVTSSTQTQISFTPPVVNPKNLPLDHPLLHCMVTCHSITQMDGQMRGDPLDLKMFESTGWILQEPENVPDGHKYDLLFPTIVRPGDSLVANESATKNGSDALNPLDLEDSAAGGILHSTASTNDLDMMMTACPLQIGIIREFPFSSSLQRMSVITRRLDDTHFKLFAKGAPEKIYGLCDKRTVPEHFHAILNSYARQGYRIIALAYSQLPAKYTITKVQKCAREVVEKNLTFLGFCVMENRLKEDTKAVIGSLADACIRTVMVTGDNILTAISVAKNCRMIKNGERVIQIEQRQQQQQPGSAGGTGGENSQSTGGEVLSQNEETEEELGSNSVMEELRRHQKSFVDNPYKDLQFSVIDYDEQQVDGGDVEMDEERRMKKRKEEEAFPSYTCIDVEKEIESGALRDCHFAVDGNTYKVIMEEYTDLSRVLLARGTIFARMSPDLKQHLVSELQRSDYYVAMCGDGANDCGALKIAHCGISLSDSEASVASPFTSRQSNISSVLDVIKEGRAALVTSFGIFKFMAAFSLVQFISVMILYSIDTNLTDIQFLYIDLVLISSFAFFFGKTKSTKKPLTREVPENSLVSRLTILSIFFQIVIGATLQAGALAMVRSQEWFVSYEELYAPNEAGLYRLNATRSFYYEGFQGKAIVPSIMVNQSNALLSNASTFALRNADDGAAGGGGGGGAGSTIGDPMACYENYTVFLVSAFQYIILVLIFSRGAPYRQPLRSNFGLLFSVVINMAFLAWLIFYPPEFLSNFFELFEPPMPPEDDGMSGLRFRVVLFAMIVSNFVVSVFVEKFLLERGWICGGKDADGAGKKPFQLQGSKGRGRRMWDRLTCAPTEQKKFQYYDHIIGAQVAPLIWSAVRGEGAERAMTKVEMNGQ